MILFCKSLHNVLPPNLLANLILSSWLESAEWYWIWKEDKFSWREDLKTKHICLTGTEQRYEILHLHLVTGQCFGVSDVQNFDLMCQTHITLEWVKLLLLPGWSKSEMRGRFNLHSTLNVKWHNLKGVKSWLLFYFLLEKSQFL